MCEVHSFIGLYILHMNATRWKHVWHTNKCVDKWGTNLWMKKCYTNFASSYKSVCQLCFQCTISVHEMYKLWMNKFCTISITKSWDVKFLMYATTYTLNMCTRKITILMQVNQNLWNFNCVQWKPQYYSNFKYDNTWHHDSLAKLHFIKSTSLKHITSDISCKLHQISHALTTNNLWFPLVTFFRWSLIVWRPHQHAHDMLDGLSCLWIHFVHIMNDLGKWHFGWIVQKIFCIPFFTPYDIYKFAH